MRALRPRLRDLQVGAQLRSEIWMGWNKLLGRVFSRQAARTLRATSNAFKVWSQERRKTLEELYIQESTQFFEVAQIHDEIGDIYDVYNLHLGPESFGLWASRPHGISVYWY